MNNPELKEALSRLSAVLQIRKLSGQGILDESDLPALRSQRRRVWDLMGDGLWHSASYIVVVAGGTEGLRRLRELRELPGVHVERKRADVGRSWVYRIVIIRPKGQLSLI